MIVCVKVTISNFAKFALFANIGVEITLRLYEQLMMWSSNNGRRHSKWIVESTAKALGYFDIYTKYRNCRALHFDNRYTILQIELWLIFRIKGVLRGVSIFSNCFSFINVCFCNMYLFGFVPTSTNAKESQF